MPVQSLHELGPFLWSWLGRVPLRTKIFGIVLAATCSTGIGIILWLNIWHGSSSQPDTSSFALAELLVVMAIAMTVGLGVAWLLTNVLTQQVQQVTRVAQQVQRGSLSQRAPVWADDDIGKLAQAFNAMMDSLAQSNEALERSNEQLGARNEELTALYELALLATHATNVGAILPRALEKIAETSGAQAGAILLTNADGTCALRASISLPAPLRQALEQFTVGDSLFRKVTATRQPVLVSSNLADVGEASALSTVGAACGLGQMWAVPLQSPRAVNGVVVLFQPVGRDIVLQDINLSFVQALCHEISIAVENASLWEELTRKEAVRARLLAKAVTAQEQERERISRELHDETGQSLTALLVQLRVFEHLQSRDAILAHAAELRTLVLETLEEVRRLARDLRPATLDELGLVPTIEWHLRTFTRNSDLRVQLEADIPEEFRLPLHTEIALYRVVQEALTNIVRHAQATQASVQLETRGDVLLLVIRDNGCGFDVAAVMNSEERGLGLHGIQERVELIGGTLAVDSTVGLGTRLYVEVPVLEKAKG